MQKKKLSFTFDEAIALLHVGSHGFKFTNTAGELFAVTLDHNDRNRIDSVNDEEIKE